MREIIFKKGDVVTHKSGKRKMVVYLVDYGKYYCRWETEDGFDDKGFESHELLPVKTKK